MTSGSTDRQIKVLDADFEAALDEVFANPLTPEQISEGRKRDPKLAVLVDANYAEFIAKGES